jgi:hypothetical protein
MIHFKKLCDFADEQAPWINEFQLSKITFVNKKPLCWCGLFSVLTLTVYYEPDTPNMEFSNLIHELRHAWQYKTMGKVKYFLCKAFMRKKLEDDAWEWEEKAINWWKEKEAAK